MDNLQIRGIWVLIYFYKLLKLWVLLGRGFLFEYWGSASPPNTHIWQPSLNWTELYDEATCGNALSAVLNFHPAPSKYLPCVSSRLQPWFQHRICSLDEAAQQRKPLEAAMFVCAVETTWMIEEAWPVESSLISVVPCGNLSELWSCDLWSEQLTQSVHISQKPLHFYWLNPESVQGRLAAVERSFLRVGSFLFTTLVVAAYEGY